MRAADERVRVIYDRNSVLINDEAANESRLAGRAVSLWHTGRLDP